MTNTTHTKNEPETFTRGQVVVAAAALTVILFWSYWPTLVEMADRWERDPQYSHGYLVPVFALVLLLVRLNLVKVEELLSISSWLRLLSLPRLWARLEQMNVSDFRPSWWGLPLFLMGIAMRHTGSYFYFLWFDPLSLIPTLLGLSLLLGGKRLLQASWPPIIFLFFMIPLPFTLESGLRGPLQKVGTRASTYLMQTIGLPAISEGNIILIDEFRIGVVEACSGLRMLMIFFALSTAVAFTIQRPTWERFVVLLSSVPIALISNITRITVTGILYVTVNSELADYVFHDLAGWLMMPFGLVLLWLELKFLSYLWIVEDQKPLAFRIEGKHSVTTSEQSRTQELASP